MGNWFFCLREFFRFLFFRMYYTFEPWIGGKFYLVLRIFSVYTRAANRTLQHFFLILWPIVHFEFFTFLFLFYSFTQSLRFYLVSLVFVLLTGVFYFCFDKHPDLMWLGVVFGIIRSCYCAD